MGRVFFTCIILSIWLLFYLDVSPVTLAAGGKQETSALLYLKKFGYIATNDGTEALVTEDNIQDYIQQGVR